MKKSLQQGIRAETLERPRLLEQQDRIARVGCYTGEISVDPQWTTLEYSVEYRSSHTYNEITRGCERNHTKRLVVSIGIRTWNSHKSRLMDASINQTEKNLIFMVQ